MLTVFYLAHTRFGVVNSPPSAGWQHFFFKTYSNKIGHNKHTSVVQNL